jgi:hypothetical protein
MGHIECQHKCQRDERTIGLAIVAKMLKQPARIVKLSNVKAKENIHNYFSLTLLLVISYITSREK